MQIMQKAELMATELMQATPGLTHAKAISTVFETNPEMYNQYEAERSENQNTPGYQNPPHSPLKFTTSEESAIQNALDEVSKTQAKTAAGIQEMKEAADKLEREAPTQTEREVNALADEMIQKAAAEGRTMSISKARDIVWRTQKKLMERYEAERKQRIADYKRK